MFFDKSCNPSFSTLPHSVRVLETNLLSLAKELISEICEIIDLFKSWIERVSGNWCGLWITACCLLIIDKVDIKRSLSQSRFRKRFQKN